MLVVVMLNGETVGITTADMGGTGGAAGSGARLTVNNQLEMQILCI